MRTLYSKSILRVKKGEGVKLRKVLSHQGFFNEHIQLRSEKYCLAGKGERSILMAEKKLSDDYFSTVFPGFEN